MYGLADFNASKPLFDLVQLDIAMIRRKLNQFEMLILCLMRLHLGMAVADLSNRFQICKSTVSKVFLLGIDMLCVKLWLIIIWPEGSGLIASIPMCFWAKFVASITTVVDCFGIYYILEDQLI